MMSFERDRTTVEYRDWAVDQAMRYDRHACINGVMSSVIPETFEQLEAAVTERRSPTCGVSEEIDDFLGVLACADNRDELVRLMPANGEMIVCIVPFEES